MSKQKPITFWSYLPEDKYRKLRSECALRGCNIRDLVNEIIESYIESLEEVKQIEREEESEESQIVK